MSRLRRSRSGLTVEACYQRGPIKRAVAVAFDEPLEDARAKFLATLR